MHLFAVFMYSEIFACPLLCTVSFILLLFLLGLIILLTLFVNSLVLKFSQSVSRSVGCQMIGEEVVASCSGGPRGNEQLSSLLS